MATNTEVEKLERRWQENPLGLTFAPLAEAYRKAGDVARALELLNVGLAQHANYVPAHIVRGRCHLDTQDTASAESSFRRVTELDPENVIALKGLADLAEKEGRLSEAVGRLEVLLEVDRNNEDARGQLDRLREMLAAPVLVDPDPLRHYESPELTPVSTGEFQLANDAIALRANEERLPEIVLQAEALEKSLPVAEAAQGRDMIAAPDPLAAKGTPLVDLGEPEPVAAFELPPAREEPAVPEAPHITELRFPPEPDDLRAEFIEPVLSEWTNSEPPTAPVPAPAEPDAKESAETFGWEQLQQPHGAFEPPESEPEPELEPESATAPHDSELVVTETMAEIFLRQGHRELALAVYSQLAQRDPENERVAGALASLKAELQPPPPVEVAPEAPVAEPQRFGAGQTGGRSVADLFAALLSSQRPTVAAAIHPPAFETRRATGEPTRAATDSLSLSSVFGDESGPPGPAAGPAEVSPVEPSFEQFFTPIEGGTPQMELPKPPDSDAPAMSTSAPEDLEQFNTWLRGLKR